MSSKTLVALWAASCPPLGFRVRNPGALVDDDGDMVGSSLRFLYSDGRLSFLRVEMTGSWGVPQVPKRRGVMRANGPPQRHAAAHPVRRPQTQNMENGSLPVSRSFSQSGSGIALRGPHWSLSMARPRKMNGSERVPQQVTACCDRAVTVP